MAHVVTADCYDCKHTHCLAVCPVDCFHEGEHSLWIDPEACIDCGACVPECPEKAIFPAAAVPPQWKDYIRLNAEMAPRCPVIVETKPGLKGREGCHPD